MSKTIYLLTLTTIADQPNRQLAFTDKALALETYDKAVERMKACNSDFTTIRKENGNEIRTYFYENGQLCQDIVMNMDEIPVMTEIYPQVSTDYYNEDEELQYVDAWPTADENDENGRSVATIIPVDKTVVFKEDTKGANCVNVFNAIEDWALEETLEEQKEIAEKLAKE